jgi:acyl-CoA synthetase (AMP-forming)/AMP-acid ligase II
MQMKRANYSTLVELLGDRSQCQSHHKAYTFLKDGEIELLSVTYQELDLQARAIASRLQQMNIANCRAILVYPYDAGLEFIAAFFGCLYANVVAVPCHPPRNHHAVYDLQDRLISSQAQIILTHKSLLKKLKSQLSNSLSELFWLTTPEISLSEASEWVEPKISSDRIAFLQYTSGSTGMPKGVAITHKCLLYNQQMLNLAFGHSETAIGVGWLPLFHDMGLIGNVLQALYLGRPSILMSPIAFVQKPVRWLQAISRYQATTSGGSNFAYDLSIAHVTSEQMANLDLSSWEVAFSGAESVSAATMERFVAKFAPCGFRPTAFYPCYGMAEATLFISGGKKTELPVVKYINKLALEENRVVMSSSPQEGFQAIVGCGQAWLDGKITIVDPKSLTECLPQQVGEIWVSGSGISQEYWNLPEESLKTFQGYLKDTKENPYLRTGDLGFLQDGELFITGRLKEILIFWGLNHYPQHIEQTVEKCHPGLRSNFGAAFSVEIDGAERLVVAQEVERSYQKTLVIDDVVEVIRWEIFEQHLIDVYAIVLLKLGSIPRTSSGKIQRHVCRAKFLDGSLDILSEWRSSKTESSNLTSVIQKYSDPLTHIKRYLTFARTKLSLLSWRG